MRTLRAGQNGDHSTCPGVLYRAGWCGLSHTSMGSKYTDWHEYSCRFIHISQLHFS